MTSRESAWLRGYMREEMQVNGTSVEVAYQKALVAWQRAASRDAEIDAYLREHQEND